MNSPMRVDELPSFVAKHNNIIEPFNDPMLKYMIVGGILLFAVVISVAIIEQQYNVTINPKENENGNK